MFDEEKGVLVKVSNLSGATFSSGELRLEFLHGFVTLIERFSLDQFNVPCEPIFYTSNLGRRRLYVAEDNVVLVTNLHLSDRTSPSV